MAWVDDRIWCHPKFTDLSKAARWAWVAGVCYSTGFQTRGRLSDGQIAQIGVTARERTELIEAGLWHPLDNGVEIHDWDDHNSKRDERRAADRERKKRQRDRDKTADSPQDVTRDIRRKSAVTARVDGSDGSEGSDCKAVNSLGLALVKAMP